MKSLGRVLKEKTIFLNCDIQSNFLKYIYGIQSVVNVGVAMTQIANVMKIPVLVTQQNPKAFGATIPEIASKLPKGTKIYDKFTFSMLNKDTEEFMKANSQRKTAVIYGMETHVCVQQTCLDLLEKGYDVHLLTDGLSSMKPIDRSTAFRRMERSGAFLTTSQSLIYEMVRSAKDPTFKPVLPSVKIDRVGLDTL